MRCTISILAVSVFMLGTLPSSYAQSTSDSTIQRIAPVSIRSYFSSQPFLQHTSSAKVLTSELLRSQAPGSMLPAINTTAGVRMEERSPGSYRLALRGSMLRSPFGVRNTKIYMDEVPLTDAGGNTYLNSIDPVGIQQITIIKGPDGSLFGPNSGGVVRITPNGFDTYQPTTSAQIAAGSFGLFHQQLTHSQRLGDKYQFSFDQSFMRSDGYRDHTASKRLYLQTTHQWDYTDKGRLKLLALFSDLDYQTPGGLTQAQFDENPRQARPATAAIPGSREQKAAIYNKTLIGGLTHEYQFNEHWTHSATLFGSYTDFRNPFISNYEFRYEKNAGVRTFLSYTPTGSDMVDWQMQVGLEAQRGWYDVKNYDNNLGVKGDPQQFDRLENGQHFYFYRASALFFDKLNAEASIGWNFNNTQFRQLYPESANAQGDINFDPTWMPRFALSYLPHPQFAIRGSLSKGYSPPTLAEVRSSNNVINVNLRPENGYNYELGLRTETKDRRWMADFSAYQYDLKEGIVRQLNEAGAEFFVNAGAIRQRGLELQLMGQIVPTKQSGFIRSMQLSSAITYQDYRFREYATVTGNTNTDYSGNAVTSIPRWISVNTLHTELPKNTGINIMHNHTSSIPLNDANTVSAKGYNLIQAKAFWIIPTGAKYRIELFAGVDNLLNEKYSLGNDINAFGGRFFNAAPNRNYYGGLRVQR